MKITNLKLIKEDIAEEFKLQFRSHTMNLKVIPLNELLQSPNNEECFTERLSINTKRGTMPLGTQRGTMPNTPRSPLLDTSNASNAYVQSITARKLYSQNRV